MTPLDLTTVEGAMDYHRTWSVNAYGPLLFSATLLDQGLLVGTKSDTPSSQPPIICNISSGQASLTCANEMWTGGSPRDELYFHPVYASSKVALSGVTMHMSRILRVSLRCKGENRELIVKDKVIVGQVHPGWIKTTMGRTYANLTIDESAGKV
jgi:NAD(P)-dependent dehydrogenase (short-subunit alcohol dehydrogenase family)